DRRAGHGSDRRVPPHIERFSPNTNTAVLVGVAGVPLPLRAGGGLYWLIPPPRARLPGGGGDARACPGRGAGRLPRQWSSGSGPRLRIVRIAKVLWAPTTEGIVRIWSSSSRS